MPLGWHVLSFGFSRWHSDIVGDLALGLVSFMSNTCLAIECKLTYSLTVVAEVFPLGLRAKGVSIGASSNWLNNFAVGMSTPDFVTAAPYGVYIFLGMMCVLGTLYVFFLVPETKNRTLDEMDELFGMHLLPFVLPHSTN